MPDQNNNFEEENEFNERTRKIGKAQFESLQETFIHRENEQTEMVMQDRTQRLGESTESTIVDDFWDYYSPFSRDFLPHPDVYCGGVKAELKITVLLNLFQKLYIEQIYPFTFPVPIVQKSFRTGKNHVKPKTKFFIVGDTHGSIKDTISSIKFFLREMEKADKEGYGVKIIFLGDTIDRGIHDIHNILLIMTFNLKFPKSVLYLRGNHEEISICSHYGFGQRVIEKFSQMLFASFCHMFKDLPLIAHYHCDQGSFMCLHGGIPIIPGEDFKTYTIPHLNTHQFVNRKVWLDEMESDTVTQQILWNDPILNEDPDSPYKYLKNRRGIGFLTGSDVFRQFCERNNVNLMFRGHQVFTEGIHRAYDNRFITIFSASEYVNKKIEARIIEMDSDDIFNFKDHIIQKLPQ